MTLPPVRVCECGDLEIEHRRSQAGPLSTLVGSCDADGCGCTLFTVSEKLSWEYWDRNKPKPLSRGRAGARETEEHRRVRETLYEQRGNVTVVPREKR